jgi:AcrR family transcriptional regulator
MRFKSERVPVKGSGKSTRKAAGGTAVGVKLARGGAKVRTEASTAGLPLAGGVTGTRADGQERRERILRAATELFARQGFEQTTTRQIAEAAKSNVAAIKYYFGDKQGLIVAVMESARNRIVEGGEPMMVVPQEDARESLKQWVVWVLKTARRRRHADATTASLMIRALAMKSEMVAPLAARLGAPVRANILLLVDELTDRSLSAHVRESAFAFIFSLCSNFIHGGVLLENMGITVPEDDAGLERLAERMTDFIVGGLHTMSDMAKRDAGEAVKARQGNGAAKGRERDAKA